MAESKKKKIKKVNKKKVIKRPIKKVAKKLIKKPKQKTIKKLVKKPNKKTVKKQIKKTVKSIRPKKKNQKLVSRLRKSKKKVVHKKIKHPTLIRHPKNPVLSPSHYPWESHATFNPAAIVAGGRIHLFYRALGSDGISRIGYASSKDGINFDVRLTYPIYVYQTYSEAQKHWPYTSPARLVFDPSTYVSGGGWGGCEDPRAVLIDGEVYITFNIFNGWYAMSVGVVSIPEKNLLDKKWLWRNFAHLSLPNGRQKNWMLFPEKFDGKFALLYNIDKGDANRVSIKYMPELSLEHAPSAEETIDPQLLPDHDVAWHYRTRSAACPPIKTKTGWLLLYHAMERVDSQKYKVGVMLLDLKDPEKVLYRSPRPILEPDFWYENDYKPGIVYASGAVIKNGKLMVYYGGGDKHIGLATIDVDELVDHLKKNQPVKLKKEKMIDVN